MAICGLLRKSMAMGLMRPRRDKRKPTIETPCHRLIINNRKLTMSLLNVTICSNCRRLVPGQCDGKLYRVSEWGPTSRLVCKGSDGAGFRVPNKFRVVRGHGIEYDVDLIPVV